jgi:hypothetical protein
MSLEYTQENANQDVFSVDDNIKICQTIEAIDEGVRTDEQKDELFRSVGHIKIKMAIPLFVSTLSATQKAAIEKLELK